MLCVNLCTIRQEGNHSPEYIAGVAQLAEQLTCNQQVVGSIPIASSINNSKTACRNPF